MSFRGWVSWAIITSVGSKLIAQKVNEAEELTYLYRSID
jgi:hypothetical protein